VTLQVLSDRYFIVIKEKIRSNFQNSIFGFSDLNNLLDDELKKNENATILFLEIQFWAVTRLSRSPKGFLLGRHYEAVAIKYLRKYF